MLTVAVCNLYRFLHKNFQHSSCSKLLCYEDVAEVDVLAGRH